MCGRTMFLDVTLTAVAQELAAKRIAEERASLPLFPLHLCTLDSCT